MADGFSFKFSKQAQEVFKKLGDKNLIRLKEAYKEIGRKFRGHMGGFFYTNKGNLRFWKDLAPSTKMQKLRLKGDAYPSLVLSGQMASSFSQEGEGDNINVISNKSATFGSKSAIAKFHQLGTKKMPKREILNDPFIKNMAEKERWDRPLSDALTRLFKRAGFKGDANLKGNIFG